VSVLMPKSSKNPVRASGLRVTGLEALRDYEGLNGHLHDYKVDVAKSLLALCGAVGSRLLVVSASTSAHARDDPDHLARDLRKLARLAVPLSVRIAYRSTLGHYTAAWDLVCRADAPNLGLGLDLFQLFMANSPLEELEWLDAQKVFLVQLADFMVPDARPGPPGMPALRPLRVFPGEGVNNERIAQVIRQLDALGYRGDYSLDACNDDYLQMPPGVVAARARRSAEWLGEDVLRRSVPLPGRLSLRRRP